MTYHTLILVGRLGKDPELKTLENGQALCSFSVACNQNGKEKSPIWFRIKTWGKLAETCQTYLKKGRMVLVEGSLVADENGGPHSWIRQDKTAAASFELNADTVRFLTQTPDNSSADGGEDFDIGF